MQTIKTNLNINCPKCKSAEIIKWGNYIIKRTIVSQRKFKCKKCNSCFTERTDSFRFKTPLWVKQQVLRLYDKEKGFVNKYDRLKKTTYSIREIAKMLKIDKGTVHYVVRKST